MNFVLLAVLVVASQLIVALGLLFIAGCLIRRGLNRAGAADSHFRSTPSRLIRELRALEDLLVEFVARSSESSRMLSVLAAHRKPLRLSTIVQEVRLGCHESKILSAPIVWAVLSILHVPGLVRMTWHGFVITKIGLEVNRRMGSHFGPAPKVTRVPAARTWSDAPARPFSNVESALAG